MLENLLKNGGFTDIIKNKNGTFDATKGNTRYIGMVLEGADFGMYKDSNVVVSDVPLEMEDEQ